MGRGVGPALNRDACGAPLQPGSVPPPPPGRGGRHRPPQPQPSEMRRRCWGCVRIPPPQGLRGCEGAAMRGGRLRVLLNSSASPAGGGGPGFRRGET